MTENQLRLVEPVVDRSPAGIPGRVAELDLKLSGLSCPHCPPKVETAIKSLTGVATAHVNMATQSAHVGYDPDRVEVGAIIREIRRAGFGAGVATTRMAIRNMHCASCVTRIELALKMTPGVVAARASSLTNSVEVDYQPERTSFDQLRGAIESAG